MKTLQFYTRFENVWIYLIERLYVVLKNEIVKWMCMGRNSDFIFFDLLLLLFPLFYNCLFIININPYTARIQWYVAVLKMIQNTEQNDKQNTNEASSM